jgi:acetylornithine deacetylase/succinyl-diaminopimelate desuccinylase-like protein
VPGGSLYESLCAARPPGGAVDELVRDPWDEFATPAGFPSGPVPFGSDLPMLRALAPDGDAILCGPGEPSAAHTPDESLTIGELASGIDLFAALGALYLESARGPGPFGPAS